MSKSTNRYGNVLYVAKTTIEANPTLPVKVSKQWARLDEVSQEKFGRPYFSLPGDKRTAVHEALKEAAA